MTSVAPPLQLTGARRLTPTPAALQRPSRIARCGGLFIHMRRVAIGVLDDPQP